MATAKTLNESYQNFLESKDGNVGLNVLLGNVREHALSKYPNEDVVQEVVLEVWRRVDPRCSNPLAPYDATRSSFSTWISLIVKTMISHDIEAKEPLDYVGSAYDLAQLEK